MININTVFQIESDEENEPIQRNRIIWITPDNETVFFVKLEGPGTYPLAAPINDIEIGLANEILILVKDPYSRTIYEDSIKDKFKVLRDRDWEVAQYLWEGHELDMLLSKSRIKRINDAALKFSLPKIKVERIIKKFWQRGMTKNALLVDYGNCGNKGQQKIISTQKRGRPSKKRKPGEEGINIDETVLQLIRRVIDNQYRKRKVPTLTAAYNYLIQHYFSDPYKDNNGDLKYRVWSIDRIPTYTQFRYWYLKGKEFKKDYVGRHGQNAFDLKYRELLHNSTEGVLGPGSIYQIDATVADLYLVSESNPLRVIGRPVVYIVIDVYSRLVCGMYVGLEGPSWIGAMMALDNVLEDKVEFCKKYEFEIDKDDWPCENAPQKIVADRGEFMGYSSDRLVNNLGILIDNTPPYRGDLKGIVERHFRTVNDRIKYTSPGAIQREYYARRDKDPRMEAEYTLNDFIRYMINNVVHHNNRIMDAYPLSKAMIADGLLPTPVSIWHWGLRRRQGRFNIHDRNIFRLNLLPEEKAYVSKFGIKFENRFYSFENEGLDQVFTSGVNKKVRIVHDPRNVSKIYLPNEKGDGYEVAKILPRSKTYEDLSWGEARFIRDSINETKEGAKREDMQNTIDRDANTEKINKEAKKRKKQAKKTQPEQSKRQITTQVRENKNAAKMENREKEKFDLEDTERKTAEILPFTPERNVSENMNNHPNRNLMDKLYRQRNTLLGKDE